MHFLLFQQTLRQLALFWLQLFAKNLESIMMYTPKSLGTISLNNEITFNFWGSITIHLTSKPSNLSAFLPSFKNCKKDSVHLIFCYWYFTNVYLNSNLIFIRYLLIVLLFIFVAFLLYISCLVFKSLNS